MSTVTLTTTELVGLVLFGVLLAATDAAALSRLGLAWLAKRLGVEPAEIGAVHRAIGGDDHADRRGAVTSDCE